MAGAAITKINGEGNIPILVGGTGLYVQSLLEGYDFQASRMTAADKRQAEEKLNSLDRENLKAYIRKETDWEPPDWHELLSNTHRLTRLVSAIEQGRDGLSSARARLMTSSMTPMSSACACPGRSCTTALKNGSTSW